MKTSTSIVPTPDVARGRELLAACAPGAVPESSAREIASAFGLKIPQSLFIPFGHALPEVLPFEGPYVVKIVSTIHIHKSEVGGVRVNLADLNAVGRAIEEMTGVLGDSLDGFIIDQLISADYELLVGGHVDPIFGPTLTVGIGGVLVELLEDVAVRLCPVTEEDIHEMLRGLKAHALISGHRGKAAANFEAIVNAVLSIGGEHGLLTQCADLLVELDVNPLRVDSTHATAVDVRLLRSEKG